MLHKTNSFDFLINYDNMLDIHEEIFKINLELETLDELNQELHKDNNREDNNYDSGKNNSKGSI